MKKLLLYACVAGSLIAGASACGKKNDATPSESPKYECIAYACTIDGALPPADMVTAINYLAAEPNETCDGMTIYNVPRLHKILDLKKENPELKVIVALGGAGAGSSRGWVEMTGNDSLRALFVADCKRQVDEYGLDGLDFDWEFPADDEQRANYKALFRDIRAALGPDKVVSAAAGYNGNGFDLKEALNYLDYISLMTYDMGEHAPYHHTSLYRSDMSGTRTVEEALDSCLSKGIDYKDIVLGLAFYGRGDYKNFKGWTDYRFIEPRDGMEERWDSVACVPYLVDSLGTMIIGYENPRSLKIKCDYIKEKGMRGGMYWRCEYDTDSLELIRTVGHELLGR